MKLTEEQAREFVDGWWHQEGQDLNLFTQNYDFPLPDHGWKRWNECPPTEEDSDISGNIVSVDDTCAPILRYVEWDSEPEDETGFWTRSPYWQPKPKDPFDGFLSKIPDNIRNDETAMYVIKTAYKLGLIQPQ